MEDFREIDGYRTRKTMPFDFNTVSDSFRVWDIVCYRAPELLGDMPFIGELVQGHEEHVILKHQGTMQNSQRLIRASREDYSTEEKDEAIKVIGNQISSGA